MLKQLIGFIVSGTVVLSLSSCAQVTSQQVSEKSFRISTPVNDAPTDFDRRRLRQQAEKHCLEGYNVISRVFQANHKMAESSLQCAQGSGQCEMTLSWQIQCSPKEKEPFSIFGNF